MDLPGILNALKHERDRIDAAIAALGNSAGRGSLRASASLRRRRKRTLSAEARRKISEAAKSRWIKAKRAGRNFL